MENSFPKLCFKVMTGICRRWTRKLMLCLLLGMTLFILWLHSQVVPSNPVVKRTLPELKETVVVKKPSPHDFNFIPKPIVYSGDSHAKERKCPNLKPPTSVPVDQFQSVDGSRSSYVFSAYQDTRNGKSEVKIVGMKSEPNGYWCQLWYFDEGNFYLEIVRAFISAIPEGAGRMFESVWLVCASRDIPSPPRVVSLSKYECGTPTNYLNVNPVITKRPVSSSFSLCVTPFNLKYDKVDEFLELMTLNQMFGMDHAYFYNYSSSHRIRRITEAMAKAGRATVVQWQLPMKVHVWPVPPGYVEEVKYFGQMAMLQDCLMRGMGKFQYLVYTDMDELAVPRRHRSWRQLFEAKGYKSRQPAAVVFRNTFFKLEWKSDPDSLKDKEIVASGSRVLLKTKREQMIYSPGSRSKYMIDPLQIRTCGVHNIWQTEGGGANIDVLGTEEGLLHHYRNWEGMGQQTFDVDRSMFRFRDEIIKRLEGANQWYKNISKNA